MPTPPSPGTFRVKVSDPEFNEDYRHASTAGKRVLVAARQELERHGVARSQLHACQRDHRDRTDLDRCLKIYLPPPGGEWGAVLQLAHDDQGWYLLAIAFGKRHPDRRPRVYDVAHRRLHGSWPPGMHTSP